MTVTINGTTGYTGPIGAIGDLSTTGNTTLGDASGDTLTINGNTASIPNGLNFTNGNIGLGAAPSAWNSDYKALDVSTYGNFYGRVATSNVGVVLNGYRNSGGSWIYKTTNAAARYEQDSGFHIWYNAGSGTAGNAITFNQAMTLNTSGNLGVGTASPSGRLHTAVADGATNALYAERTGASPAQFTVNFANQISNLVSSSAMTFSANGSERARITAAGNLCVNTTLTFGGFSVSTPNNNGYTVVNSAGTGNAAIFGASGDTGFGSSGNNAVINSLAGGILFSANGTEAARIDTSQRLLQRAGRKSNAYVLGNQQMWVAATGSLANGSAFSLCTINNTYDNLCYELDIFVNRGGFFACKYAGVFGYNGFTKAVSTGDVGAAAFTSTGTLYNETMTITNSSGVTVNQYVICLRIWGYYTAFNVSTGGTDLVTSSYLTRIE